MIRHVAVRASLGAMLCLMTATACGKDSTGPGSDPNDPNNPSALGLAVAVRIDDPATFPTTGAFTLELIPTSATGQVLVNEPWTITNTLSAPTTATTSLLSQAVSTPDPRPFAVALDLDNSGSIITNDPNRSRADAAEQFWSTLFQQNASSEASLFFFGNTPDGPSPGFSVTHMVRGWTSTASQLNGILDTLGVGSQSPMYTSLREVAKWVDTTADAATYRRALVVLSDGEPNDASQRDALIQVAKAAGIPIYAVGFGPGSDRGTKTDPIAVAVLQSLANETGGLYAGTATPDRISSVLQSFAVSSTSGTLLAHFTISPVPASGTTVAGTVKLTSTTRGIAQAPWSFVAP